MSILEFRTDPRFRSCPQAFLVTGTRNIDLNKKNRDLLRQHRTGHWKVAQGRVNVGDAMFLLLPSMERRDGYPRQLFGGVLTNINHAQKRALFSVATFFELPQIVSRVKEYLGGNVPPTGNLVLKVWDAQDGKSALDAEFEAAVRAAIHDSPERRWARIAAAPRLPRKIIVTSEVFIRDPHIVAERLLRANGVCDGCYKPAPFNRASDGTPYLEVHHRVRLADQGEDTLDNTHALCPNCHRQRHFGQRVT